MALNFAVLSGTVGRSMVQAADDLCRLTGTDLSVFSPKLGQLAATARRLTASQLTLLSLREHIGVIEVAVQQQHLYQRSGAGPVAECLAGGGPERLVRGVNVPAARAWARAVAPGSARTPPAVPAPEACLR